jgi:RNA polymerase sigma-70 factor (ECF subfamily)
MNKTDVMEKIYLEYREKVFRYVRGKVRNEADAEDILSEIFLKIQTSLHSYDEKKATLSTWIYTITHNAVCNYYRQQSKRELSLDEDALCPDTDDGVMTEIENEILKEELAVALETLTEREQDIIVLYYYYEMPLRDIAIKMGITYTNAKFIKSTAMGKLRTFMKQNYGYI